jgi:hypothetical protein
MRELGIECNSFFLLQFLFFRVRDVARAGGVKERLMEEFIS